ncbi:MAG TPA: pitrilysin family protein, partial [Pyrinomonadaceae bacterium]|nr:pitrilysin family protein [Pyrinomonadaceae bacterium]
KKALLTTLFLTLLLGSLASGGAQGLPEPRRQELLNGLRILMWERPGDSNVYLKLRVHSGAAFDLAGKSGMMALLGDALFPDPTTREYFAEELGGRLEVTSDYDSINVTMVGRASEFERMLELLRTALVSTQLTPEVVAKLRDARVKMVRELNVSPVMLADRAAATRLFGDYPYGRLLMGTPDSLARVERVDLILARDRFLNPNNSTLVITGGVDERRATRALKQLLGGWRRSDTVVPATFRQPAAADARTLIVDLPGVETAEVRLAVRGLARSDKDWASASLLALIARDEWQAAQPGLGRTAFFVRHEAHVLPGIFMMGAAVAPDEAPGALASARKILQQLARSGATQDQLDKARNEALAELNKQTERPESVADLWLDADTYQLGSVEERLRQMRSVSVEDLKRTAARLFKEDSVATVALGSAERLKSALERSGKVEILGAAVAAPAPDSTRTPNKKQ